MSAYLCKVCGHSLTMHNRVTSHCQVLDCGCTWLSPGESRPPAVVPAMPADAREQYIASIKTAIHDTLLRESPAEAIDFVRAAWDAGFLHAQRKAGNG